MKFNNNIENLELKLKNALEENAEVFHEAEKAYDETYRNFVDHFFESDILWASRNISGAFQLEYFNILISHKGNNKNSPLQNTQNLEIAFKDALHTWLKNLPIESEKKEKLQSKMVNLSQKKEDYKEIFTRNTEFTRDSNYPILENLLSQKVISESELLRIYSSFQKTKNIKLSLQNIPKEKKSIILEYFYEVNSWEKEERIDNFKREYHSEIEKLNSTYSWPIIEWVVSFVGRNFLQLKPYKNKNESKTMRLRRTFKMALLKLLRIKYSGFWIESLLKKVENLEDFESLFAMMHKLIDIIPENSEVLEHYTIQEDIDEAHEIVTEAENNKEKILSWEEATLEVCSLIGDIEHTLDQKMLDKILSDDVDIVGDTVKFRDTLTHKEDVKLAWQNNSWNLLDWWKTLKINNWILFHTQWLLQNDSQEKEEEDDIPLSETELIQTYHALKIEYSIAEKKKQKMFAYWQFDRHPVQHF